MDIILVSRVRGRTWRIGWNPRSVLAWLPVAALVFAVGAIGVEIGLYVGARSGASDGTPLFDRVARIRTASPASTNPLLHSWNAQIDQQRDEIRKLRESTRANADALARKIAQLQADMMRVDAAGQRMAQIAHIDSKEFDFSQPAPMGGPADPNATAAPVMDGTMAMLDAMQKRLDDRQRQMSVLEDILRTSRLQKEITPAGWPIKKGYISSGYGARIDPFTGLRSFHPGIDIAGPKGEKVHAVAAGIVTHAGPDAGYGNLVEINHGNGYVTLYGHNEKVLVHVGERVHRGQAIALEGATGRATGPHCHFEVRINGKVVDPTRFLEASR